jgi:hypothetical protein
MNKPVCCAALCAVLFTPLAVAEEAADGITVGGAVRVQYSFEDYVAGNRERAGDFDLDTVRLNLDGTVGEVILSAEWRYYQYMQVIHHAWVGYDFSEAWRAQLGVTRVPFGNQPYNSNSYFFDTTYYVGLEDDHDMGLLLHGKLAPFDLQIAFFKNDEQGGVDGFVSDRTERYSYDVLGLRPAGEGTFAEPTVPIGEANTFVLRAAWSGERGALKTELGLSALRGDLVDTADTVGSHRAGALHLKSSLARWTLMLQATRYEYRSDIDAERVAVGAYAFYDSIPAEAELYTANLAYAWPVQWGPVSSITFYNDHSLMSGKRGVGGITRMNVLGMGVAAGGLYTYFDLVTGRNQPFIGGSLGENAADANTRFNINVGYYF